MKAPSGAQTPARARADATTIRRQQNTHAHSTSATSTRQPRVMPFLHPGEEKAISTRTLVRLTGAKSARQLQIWIASERRAGIPILSSTHGGYYLPDTGEKGQREAWRFYKALRSRAISTLAAARVARQFLRVLPGQSEINDGGDEHGRA